MALLELACLPNNDSVLSHFKRHTEEWLNAPTSWSASKASWNCCRGSSACAVCANAQQIKGRSQRRMQIYRSDTLNAFNSGYACNMMQCTVLYIVLGRNNYPNPLSLIVYITIDFNYAHRLNPYTRFKCQFLSLIYHDL